MAGQDQAAPAAPAREPDKSAGRDVHKVTEVLRAPLSVASSVSAEIVDAAIGDGSRGIGSKARRAGAGFAAALAVTAVATRRRRRRPEPTAGHPGPAETTAGHATPAETTAVEALPREPDVVKLVFFREVRNDTELRMPLRARQAAWGGRATPNSQTSRTSPIGTKRSVPLS